MPLLNDSFNEVWKPCPNYEQTHEVSNLGRVRSLTRANSLGRVRQGKVLSQVVQSNGYAYVAITSDKGLKRVRVHRLVATAFVDNVDNKPYVNHIDGNKLNNCVSNLEWVTASENANHAVNNGLIHYPKGERCHNSKLTQEQVDEIRLVYVPYDRNYGQYALVNQYGVSRSTIEDVVHKCTWV